MKGGDIASHIGQNRRKEGTRFPSVDESRCHPHGTPIVFTALRHLRGEWLSYKIGLSSNQLGTYVECPRTQSNSEVGVSCGRPRGAAGLKPGSYQKGTR